jgi:hypothetical protein
MGCKCPDDTLLPNGGCNYLIYSGGPIENLYRLVAQAIPGNAEITHGRPVVHDDGSLEFPGEPPVISGYLLNGSRLYTVWPPCAMRMLAVQILNKQLTVEGICGSPPAGHFSLKVTTDQCRDCLVRQAP